MQQRLINAAVLASAMVPALAQTSLNETPSTAPSTLASSFDVHTATTKWRTQHGAEWRTIQDKQTQHVRFLHGWHTEGLEGTVSDADFTNLARVRVGEAYGMFGINPDELNLDRVTFLPLGMIGSSDKTTVRFTQSKDGIPVEGGSVNVLFDQAGRLLSIDTIGLPDALLPVETRATRNAQKAEELAIAAFEEATGLAAIDVVTKGLVIVQEELGALRQGTLAWSVSVGNKTPGQSPEAFTYSVSARGDGRIVNSQTEIHYFDVGGGVQTVAMGGNQANSPTANMPAAYMRITSPQAGTTVSDQFGNFNFPGVTGPITATFTYDGTYNEVDTDLGAEYSFTTTLANGGSNTVLMNSAPNESVTAQANAFVYINKMREWTLSLNPLDTASNFEADANTDLNDTCNAYYDGGSTNYFRSGGGCNNTGFSNVIYHEMGHWMNDRYSSGNGSDGFGEGNADVFAMYQADSPFVGDGWTGPGTNIRSGLNTLSFCGDANPGCYGAVHTDGQVLMGALWKVRLRLNATQGDAPGDFISSLLFNSWMNAYDDGQIKTIIETHWLTLDDDDGNVGNGSPHFSEIDAGFKDQGFPGFTLIAADISNVNGPSDTLDENGPYGVSARIIANIGTAITSATMNYSVNGGPHTAVPMTAAAGDIFYATIPGQASPNKVEWWLTATTNSGGTNNYPSNAPVGQEAFRIGLLNTFFFEDFENAGDAGWTHIQIQEQDDWQRGTPLGKAGDPSTAYSGSNAWANDIGATIGGANWNGAYKPNVNNVLFSPQINLNGASGAQLVYRRWLTVEEGIFDQASIKVNGNTVWTNPLNGDLVDNNWVEHEVDVSAFDGQMAQLEWHLVTDGGKELGGWNIDDVSIRTLSSTPSLNLPTFYGSSTPGSTLPTIDTAGETANIGNGSFRVVLKDGLPETQAYMGFGLVPTSAPFLGVNLLVVAEHVYGGQTDLFGQFSLALPLPNDPTLIGIPVFFQAMLADGAGSSGLASTNGMQVVIQP